MFDYFFIEFYNRLDFIKEGEEIIKSNDFDYLIDEKQAFILEHHLKDNDDLIDFIIYSFYYWFLIYF